MAKNDVAKSLVIDKIKQAFGEDFLGIVDKKVYVLSKEDGQKVQVAITLTCPKTPVEFAGTTPTSNLEFGFGDLDFTSESASTPPSAQAEVSDEEQKNIADLLARLGL